MFVLREDFLNALDRMVIEEPTEQLRRKPRRDLPAVPERIQSFMDAKPGTLKRGGRKQTTSNGRAHLR